MSGSEDDGGTAPVVQRLTVRRTARYATLGGGGGDVRSVWYVLHGYLQLADRFIGHFRELATPSRLIVAPEGLNRSYVYGPSGKKTPDGADVVGASWMTRHDRDAEIADYVAYLDALDRSLRLPRGVRRIVLGFSQGSQTAARWVALGRRRLARLVLWGGVLPPDLDVAQHAARLRPLAPVIVRSEQDPSLPPGRVDAEIERLAALGVEATSHRHAGGHTIGRDALRELAARIDPSD